MINTFKNIVKFSETSMRKWRIFQKVDFKKIVIILGLFAKSEGSPSKNYTKNQRKNVGKTSAETFSNKVLKKHLKIFKMMIIKTVKIT